MKAGALKELSLLPCYHNWTLQGRILPRCTVSWSSRHDNSIADGSDDAYSLVVPNNSSVDLNKTETHGLEALCRRHTTLARFFQTVTR